MNDEQVRGQVAIVEALLDDLDPRAAEAVEGLVSLYGEALRRIVDALKDAPAVVEALSRDELVAHVFLLHDLHPRSLEERVRRALDEVRPYLGSHGGEVDVTAIAGGVAHVRLGGTCAGCAASTATVKSKIEQAVLRAVPELHAVVADDPHAQPAVPAPAAERCDLCSEPISEAHRHVVERETQELLCACRACSLLFDRSGAGGVRYRLVPDRCLRLDDLQLDDLAWRSLRIPVDMAFFVRHDDGRVTAFYPSPAGPTQSLLELDAWSELERAHPALRSLEPDVEALLVNGTGTARVCRLVGIDHCYRLVALMRRHWTGFTGGATVWAELERFFADLDAVARPRAHAAKEQRC